MSRSQFPREYTHSRGALTSAQHVIILNPGKEGQDRPTSETQLRAKKHSIIYRKSAPGIPAGFINNFSSTGFGSGSASLPPPQAPTPTNQLPSTALKGTPGPAKSSKSKSSKSKSRNLDQPKSKDVAPLSKEERYIRNRRKDDAIVNAEAVILSPPGPHQPIPEYTTPMTTRPTRPSTTVVARRIPRVIEPGDLLVMLFDDGPSIVQAVEPAPYLVYSVRARLTIMTTRNMETWRERKYAIVDPRREGGPRGRQWYRFVQPSEIRPSEVRPLMKQCLERKGWEFVDARPPGWHTIRRENEVPLLEMMVNTEIDWKVTEWMVGDAGYVE